MIRILLKMLNAPFLILFVLIGIAIQSSLFAAWPLRGYFQPNIVLLTVIWCALRRNFTEGGIITLMIAEMSEMHTSAPQGLYLLSYILTYVLIRFSARLFLLPSLTSYAVLSWVSRVLWQLMNVLLLALLGSNVGRWQTLVFSALSGAFSQALFSIWLYPWLEKWDGITFKKQTRAKRVMHTELQWNSEGF